MNEDVDMQAKMAALSRRLKELEARGALEIKVVNDFSMQIVQCSICQYGEHLVSEHPLYQLLEKYLWNKLMLLDLLNTPIVLHFQIPLIRGGRIIQIYLGRVDKDNFLLTCKLLNIKFHR